MTIKISREGYERLLKTLHELKLIPVPEMYGEVSFGIENGEVVESRTVIKRRFECFNHVKAKNLSRDIYKDSMQR